MGMVLCLREVNAEALAELRANADAADEFLFDEQAFEKGEIVDFDKAWNALHFMFTGKDAETDHPLSFFPNNPDRIGTDNGYGGPWVFTPEQVKAFQTSLAAISDEELEARYDPVSMAKHDVYLADTFVDEGPEALEYIMQSVPDLRALMERSAANGSSVVGIIT
jgi:hypothetical protein